MYLLQAREQILRGPGLFWICLWKAVLVNFNPTGLPIPYRLPIMHFSILSYSLLATALRREDYDLYCTYKKMRPEKSDTTHMSPGIWTQAVWRPSASSKPVVPSLLGFMDY